MSREYEIRASFDRTTIVVYQAYAPNIAGPAVERQQFVPPFSLQRMTWIKPSFLWLMHRSNWAQKSGQEKILAIHITRESWEKVLGIGVLTAFEPSVHGTKDIWADAMANAEVHVQWDPERSLRGAALQRRSIQVGVGRSLISEYTERWITRIEDITSLVTKMRALLRGGDATAASRLLPKENIYPLPPALARKLLIL